MTTVTTEPTPSVAAGDAAADRHAVGGAGAEDDFDAYRADLTVVADRLVRWAAQLFALEARWLRALAAFDRRGGWVGPGVRSCAHWLSWRCGISLHAGREKVRVARRLEQLPKIAEAFARGELSYSKVRAMTRVATEGNEELLLEYALSATASQLDAIVAGVRRSEEDEAVEKDIARREGRNLPDPQLGVLRRMSRPDGLVEWRLVMQAEDAAQVGAALQAAIDRLDAHGAAPIPPGEHVPAGTSEDGAEPAGPLADVPAGTSETAPGTVPRVRPWAERAVEGLLLMARSYLAGSSEGVADSDRYEVVVHVDARVLAACLEPGLSAQCRLEDGAALPVHVVRRIACDATLTSVLDDLKSGCAGAGRRSRVVPRRLRRVLKERDGGCRFPGCSERRWVDAHHIWHWADGGPTELWNLVLLCRHHHGLVHEHNYQIRLEGRRVEFFRADGTPLASAARMPDADLAQADTWHAARVAAGASVAQPTCRWTGERWERDTAVYAVHTTGQVTPDGGPVAQT